MKPSRPVWQVIEGDCRQALASLPTASVDAVVTDPPWNLGKRYGAHDDAMAPDRYAAWLTSVLRDCARVCGGPIVLLPGAMNAELVRRVLAAAGLRLLDELTWHKPEPEPVICTGACGLWRATTRTITAFEPPAGAAECSAHPCPKPFALMLSLVGAATQVGETVLDPFAGTGTTLVAAVATGRSAIGIELETRFCDVARRRLRRRNDFTRQSP